MESERTPNTKPKNEPMKLRHVFVVFIPGERFHGYIEHWFNLPEHIDPHELRKICIEKFRAYPLSEEAKNNWRQNFNEFASHYGFMPIFLLNVSELILSDHIETLSFLIAPDGKVNTINLPK